jgi:hypothetical protein
MDNVHNCDSNVKYRLILVVFRNMCGNLAFLVVCNGQSSNIAAEQTIFVCF